MNQSPQVSVAQAILKQLQHFGVEYIFGVTGDAIFGLLSEIAKQDQIKFVLTRHESAAGFMASSYAKLTGKLGVCVATSGPGMANLLNGLGDAYADKVPVLAITGQVPTSKIGTHYKQYIDQQRFIEPLAAYSSLLTSPSALIPLLSNAVQTAIKQKAVAHLSIPKDLFVQPFTNLLIPPNPYLYVQSPSDLSEISKAAEFLSQCKRPIILAGHGARNCSQEIELIATKLGAGIILTLGAKGLIPDNFRFMLGGIGEGGSEEATALLSECDGLLIVGAMWYPKTFLPPNISFVQIEQEKDHIQLDKNLYSAIIGKSKEVLIQLTNSLTTTPDPVWAARVQDFHREWQNRLANEANSLESPIHPAYIMRTLAECIADDAVIAIDTGDHTVWFNRSFTAKNQETLFSGTWRTLGFALPAGICAGLIYSERQIVVLAGDGGFMMNLGELSTIKLLGLPIKIVVLNNHSFAMEKNKMYFTGLESFAVKLENPHFAHLASAFGIEGARVEESGDLKKQIQIMLQKEGPYLLEVMSSTNPTPLSIVQAVSSRS